MSHLEYQRSKIIGDSYCSHTKLFYSVQTFYSSKNKHVRENQRENEREREGGGRSSKGLSTYLLCSHPTTLSLNDSYERLTPTSLLGFQNSTAVIFKSYHFYVFSIWIIYRIITLSQTLTSTKFTSYIYYRES